MHDIRKNKRKTLKKNKKKKIRKIQKTTINVFLVLFFLYSIFLLESIFEKTYIKLYNVISVSQFFREVNYWKCSNKTPTPIQICTGLIDVVLRP